MENEMKRYHYLKGVVTLGLCDDTCIGCGMCGDVCPHGVFRVNGRKAFIVDRDACMECGACARNCPVGAITVKSGVGCANAVIRGALAGTEPICGESCQSASPQACCS